MQVVLTRDSVAAGDDVDAPHRVEMSSAHGTGVADVILMVVRSAYLPLVAGGQATWSVVSRRPIAVIAQQWKQPRMVSPSQEQLENLKREDDALRLHFNYHAQQDPDVVVEVLGRLNRAGF